MLNRNFVPDRLLLAVVVAAFAAFAVGAADDANAGKGVVAVAYDGKTAGVQPVAILDIDGRIQPLPLRDTHYLDPGKHTFRLAALIDDNADIQRGNIDKPGAKRMLEIDVQAGKRYLLGAKMGRTAADWEPVVFRVEERGTSPAK